ncbi:hypothetical protein NPIL_57491, partial [Nephila pilipes]
MRSICRAIPGPGEILAGPRHEVSGSIVQRHPSRRRPHTS